MKSKIGLYGFLLFSVSCGVELKKVDENAPLKREEFREIHNGIGVASDGVETCYGALLTHSKIMITSKRCLNISQGIFWFDNETEPHTVLKSGNIVDHSVVLLDRIASLHIFTHRWFEGWDGVQVEAHNVGSVVSCEANKAGYHTCGEHGIKEGSPLTFMGSNHLAGLNIDGRYTPLMLFYDEFKALKDDLLRE